MLPVCCLLSIFTGNATELRWKKKYDFGRYFHDKWVNSGKFMVVFNIQHSIAKIFEMTQEKEDASDLTGNSKMLSKIPKRQIKRTDDLNCEPPKGGKNGIKLRRLKRASVEWSE